MATTWVPYLTGLLALEVILLLIFNMKVEELAEYGTLEESSSHHSVERLCKFTIQAAGALEYLEKKNLVHQLLPFHCMVAAGYQVNSDELLGHKIQV